MKQWHLARCSHDGHKGYELPASDSPRVNLLAEDVRLRSQKLPDFCLILDIHRLYLSLRSE